MVVQAEATSRTMSSSATRPSWPSIVGCWVRESWCGEDRGYRSSAEQAAASRFLGRGATHSVAKRAKNA